MKFSIWGSIFSANAYWLAKVKRHLQLAAFFSMTIQLPRILALLTRKELILKARWRGLLQGQKIAQRRNTRALAEGGNKSRPPFLFSSPVIFYEINLTIVVK